jgi:hypothetical protein
MSITGKLSIDHDNLPKCETGQHETSEAGINFCNKVACPHFNKYYCLDCGEHHDHAPISYQKHLNSCNSEW